MSPAYLLISTRLSLKWSDYPQVTFWFFTVWPFKPNRLTRRCVTWRETDKAAFKKKKKKTIENWSRENPKVVWKSHFQISIQPIFTAAPSDSRRLRLLWLRGHNLTCVLCVNQVAQCNVATNCCCQWRRVTEIVSRNTEHRRKPPELSSTVALHSPPSVISTKQDCLIV